MIAVVSLPNKHYNLYNRIQFTKFTNTKSYSKFGNNLWPFIAHQYQIVFQVLVGRCDSSPRGCLQILTCSAALGCGLTALRFIDKNLQLTKRLGIIILCVKFKKS